MENGRASQSAEGCAALRADHLLHDAEPVFCDSLALSLLGDAMREMVVSREFRRIVEDAELRPTQGHCMARARYAEDELARSLAAGIDQYVVLAAGLDSYALRVPAAAAKLRIYEVDFPASQDDKRQRLRRAQLEDRLSERCRFVPIDFEREALPGALGATDFDAERPAFFSWVGVVMYLTRDAIFASLEGMREAAAPGSHVVFDYPVHWERLDRRLRDIAAAKTELLAAGGEQRKVTFDPDELESEIEGLGFERVEQVSSRELDPRYFAGRSDGLRANPENWIAHFRSR